MAEEIELDGTRTCKNCVKSEVCRWFHDQEKIAGDLVQHGAPAKVEAMFVVLANCCLLYQKKKKV